MSEWIRAEARLLRVPVWVVVLGYGLIGLCAIALPVLIVLAALDALLVDLPGIESR